MSCPGALPTVYSGSFFLPIGNRKRGNCKGLLRIIEIGSKILVSFASYVLQMAKSYLWDLYRNYLALTDVIAPSRDFGQATVVDLQQTY